MATLHAYLTGRTRLVHQLDPYPARGTVWDSPALRTGDDPEPGASYMDDSIRWPRHSCISLHRPPLRPSFRHRDGKRKATLGRAAGTMPLVRDRQPAWLGTVVGAMLRLQDPVQQSVFCIGFDRWYPC
jgi:hypothetical protein